MKRNFNWFHDLVRNLINKVYFMEFFYGTLTADWIHVVEFLSNFHWSTNSQIESYQNELNINFNVILLGVRMMTGIYPTKFILWNYQTLFSWLNSRSGILGNSDWSTDSQIESYQNELNTDFNVVSLSVKIMPAI